MNTHSPVIEAKPRDLRVAKMLEQLQTLRSHSVGDYLLVFFLAASAMCIAWFQGYQYFIVCSSLLMVVFVIQGVTEVRARRQTELFLRLLAELQQQNPNAREQIG